jgi:hypothetical protein
MKHRNIIQPQNIEARYLDRTEAAEYLRTTPGVLLLSGSRFKPYAHSELAYVSSADPAGI